MASYGQTKNPEQCPFCEEGILHCIDSRPSTLDNVVRRRRRECSKCNKRITTHEVIINEKGIGQEQIELEVLRFINRVELAAREVFGEDFKMLGSRLARAQKK